MAIKISGTASALILPEPAAAAATLAALPPLHVAERSPGAHERLVRWGMVAALHGLLLYGVLHLAIRQDALPALASISVRLLPMQENRKPETLPPPPAAPARKATPQPPQPVLAAKAAQAPANFVVAPQPPAPPPAPIAAAPAPSPAPAPAAPAPAPVSAARFDADYLHNPKPVYPPFSRRANEEGRVMLRVKVSADGAALDLEIKQSSGFPRLDNAAREAVTKWRFVPAKRGDEAIESWVMVPITFTLD